MEILCTHLASELCRMLENRHLNYYHQEYENRQLTKFRHFQSTLKTMPISRHFQKTQPPKSRVNPYLDYSVTIGYLLSTPKPYGAPYLHATHVRENFSPKRERTYRYFKPENTINQFNVTQYSDNRYLQNVKANVKPIRNPRHWVKYKTVRKSRKSPKITRYSQVLNGLVEFWLSHVKSSISCIHGCSIVQSSKSIYLYIAWDYDLFNKLKFAWANILKANKTQIFKYEASTWILIVNYKSKNVF